MMYHTEHFWFRVHRQFTPEDKVLSRSEAMKDIEPTCSQGIAEGDLCTAKEQSSAYHPITPWGPSEDFSLPGPAHLDSSEQDLVMYMSDYSLEERQDSGIFVFFKDFSRRHIANFSVCFIPHHCLGLVPRLLQFVPPTSKWICWQWWEGMIFLFGRLRKRKVTSLVSIPKSSGKWSFRDKRGGKNWEHNLEGKNP